MIKHTESSRRTGRNLRKIRLQKGLMQIDVAVATNLHRTYVSRIENGRARVSFFLLCKIVRGLNITSDDLVEDEILTMAKQVALSRQKEEGGDNHS